MIEIATAVLFGGHPGEVALRERNDHLVLLRPQHAVLKRELPLVLFPAELMTEPCRSRPAGRFWCRFPRTRWLVS